ncbi:unnamed protein product, partial [Ectocarpus sp. 12 AP-2014]
MLDSGAASGSRQCQHITSLAQLTSHLVSPCFIATSGRLPWPISFSHERFVKSYYPADMQAPTTATSTAARCRWHPQQQSCHTHQAPLTNNNIRRRKPSRRRSSSSAFSTS